MVHQWRLRVQVATERDAKRVWAGRALRIIIGEVVVHHGEEEVRVAQGSRHVRINVDARRILRVRVQHAELRRVAVGRAVRPLDDVSPDFEVVDASAGLQNLGGRIAYSPRKKQ